MFSRLGRTGHPKVALTVRSYQVSHFHSRRCAFDGDIQLFQLQNVSDASVHTREAEGDALFTQLALHLPQHSSS